MTPVFKAVESLRWSAFPSVIAVLARPLVTQAHAQIQTPIFNRVYFPVAFPHFDELTPNG